jgi:hypothetical protein
MNKMKKTLMAAAIIFGTCVSPVAALQSLGQEITDASGNVVSSDATQSKSSGGGFYDIVFGSGVVGMLLWFALFGDGALAIYFSIDSSILIKPDRLMPKKLLDSVQAAMAEGDEKALKVYIQIGRFLAHAIPWYNEFYDYENMMILGRVTSGLGGSIILETAKTVLKDCYPEWAEKIDIFMPDEKARRLGQSVAAAQIPVIRK